MLWSCVVVCCSCCSSGIEIVVRVLTLVLDAFVVNFLHCSFNNLIIRAKIRRRLLLIHCISVS